MTTLVEIKALVAKHRLEESNYREMVEQVAERGYVTTRDRVTDDSYNRGQQYAIEMIESLLPIAEAAVALENEKHVFRHASEIDGDCTCGICGGDWSDYDNPKHESSCIAKLFIDALATLK